MEIYKFKNVFDIEIRAKCFYSWCHNDDIIIEILVKLLDVDWFRQ